MKPLFNMARSAGFAHLLGLSAKRAEEDDEGKKARRAKANEDDENEKDDEERAEEDKREPADDSETEDEGAEDGDEEGKKAKKAKKASRADDGDDEDEEAEDEDDQKEKAARRAERARCAAIFRCGAAGVRPDMAAHLAFETSMSAKKAIAMLDVAASGGAQRAGLSRRMSAVQNPSVGGDSAPAPSANDPKSVAAMINAAANKARGNA
jgi:hypothetical protein